MGKKGRFIAIDGAKFAVCTKFSDLWVLFGMAVRTIYTKFAFIGTKIGKNLLLFHDNLIKSSTFGSCLSQTYLEVIRSCALDSFMLFFCFKHFFYLLQGLFFHIPCDPTPAGQKLSAKIFIWNWDSSITLLISFDRKQTCSQMQWISTREAKKKENCDHHCRCSQSDTDKILRQKTMPDNFKFISSKTLCRREIKQAFHFTRWLCEVDVCIQSESFIVVQFDDAKHNSENESIGFLFSVWLLENWTRTVLSCHKSM